LNRARAKELRKNLTDAENKLWRHLRYRQIDGNKFRRQHPVGPYIVDFACLEKGLVVEVDGAQHGENAAYDSERSAYLQSKGFRVLRFWNNDVLTQTEVVKEVIMGALG
jgi:primosomal protein N' (replication factor Y)